MQQERDLNQPAAFATPSFDFCECDAVLAAFCRGRTPGWQLERGAATLDHTFLWHLCEIPAVTAPPLCASVFAPRWKRTAQLQGAPRRAVTAVTVSPRNSPREEFVRLTSQPERAMGMFCNKEGAKLKMSARPQRTLL